MKHLKVYEELDSFSDWTKDLFDLETFFLLSLTNVINRGEAYVNRSEASAKILHSFMEKLKADDYEVKLIKMEKVSIYSDTILVSVLGAMEAEDFYDIFPNYLDDLQDFYFSITKVDKNGDATFPVERNVFCWKSDRGIYSKIIKE